MYTSKGCTPTVFRLSLNVNRSESASRSWRARMSIRSWTRPSCRHRGEGFKPGSGVTIPVEIYVPKPQHGRCDARPHSGHGVAATARSAMSRCPPPRLQSINTATAPDIRLLFAAVARWHCDDRALNGRVPGGVGHTVSDGVYAPRAPLPGSTFRPQGERSIVGPERRPSNVGPVVPWPRNPVAGSLLVTDNSVTFGL